MIFLNSTYFYEKCRNPILARSSQTHAHARTVTIGTARRAARRTDCRPACTARHRSAVFGCARSLRPLRTRPASLWLMAQALCDVAVTAHHAYFMVVREIFESKVWGLSYKFRL